MSDSIATGNHWWWDDEDQVYYLDVFIAGLHEPSPNGNLITDKSLTLNWIAFDIDEARTLHSQLGHMITDYEASVRKS